MNASIEPVLRLSNVEKFYGTEVRQQILNNINLEVPHGEFMAIIGESGSGKTTLLNLLGLLDRPSGGEIWLQGEEVGGLSENARARLRRRALGFVFQFHYLLPGFSILENALMPLLVAGEITRERRDFVRELLDRVGLTPHLRKRPHQISGGQAQRTAIVRALANAPALVLADEPTGNLDHRNSIEAFALLREMNERIGTSFIIVTHSAELASLTSRQVLMQDGKLIDSRAR